MKKGLEETPIHTIYSPREDGTEPKILFLPAKYAGWINKMLMAGGAGGLGGFIFLGIPGAIIFFLLPPAAIYYILKNYYIDKNPHYASDCKEEFWERVEFFSPRKRKVEAPLVEEDLDLQEGMND